MTQHTHTHSHTHTHTHTHIQTNQHTHTHPLSVETKCKSNLIYTHKHMLKVFSFFPLYLPMTKFMKPFCFHHQTDNYKVSGDKKGHTRSSVTMVVTTKRVCTVTLSRSPDTQMLFIIPFPHSPNCFLVRLLMCVLPTNIVMHKQCNRIRTCKDHSPSPPDLTLLGKAHILQP